MRSLRLRLAVLAGAFALVGLAVGGAWVAGGLREAVTARFDAELRSVLVALAADIEADAAGAPVLARPPADPKFFRPLSGWYWAVIVEGETVAAAPSLGYDDLGPDGEGADPRGAALRRLMREVTAPGLDGPALLVATAPQAEIAAAVEAALAPLRAVLGVLALGLVGAIAAQAWLGLAPLGRLAADIGRVRDGKLDRLPPARHAELGPVVAEINDLVADNRALVARARRDAEDLSHALKTPLSVIANALDRDAPQAEAARKAARLMDRLIRHRLRRAGAAGVAHGARAPLDPVIADIALVLAPQARARGVEIAVEVAGAPVFAGAAEDAAEMIGALAENAVRWARGRVVLGARLAEPGWLAVSITDDGPGMTAAAAAEALARGARLDGVGEGHGLGLAIAAGLAEAHGGTLTLDTHRGGGLAATLRLPARAA
ncbi:MAG: sensor histidine kinase [Rhodobacteraceae bacterium]|nr:MAG: sensor histidine kinase [Paracoccaceae bacterium]